MRMKNPMVGMAIAAALLGGVAPAPSAKQVTQNIVSPRRLEATKRKGRFPQASGGRYRKLCKYPGHKLRKMRFDRAADAWKEHLKICKKQNVQSEIKEDQIIDLW